MTANDLRQRRHILLAMLTACAWRDSPAGTPPVLAGLRQFLGGWLGIGRIVVGMARQGYDLQLTRYGDEGWRATFYPAGRGHSVTSAVGSAWGVSRGSRCSRRRGRVCGSEKRTRRRSRPSGAGDGKEGNAMSQLRTGMRCGLGLLVAVGLLGMPGWSAAQPEPGGLTATHGIVSSDGTAHTGSSPAPELRTFGTESTVAHTIQAFEFVPVANTGGYSGDELRGAIACIAFPCVFFAPVLLPAGAVVNSIELEGCDTDAMANMSVAFLRRGPLGPNIPPAQMDTLASASTTGTPGCTRILQALATPETIDNLNNSYVLRVGSPASTPPSPVKNFFYAVRVFYRLQVSPAPAVATFTDVPTSHPFFRFVEALAASGITVGCGGGNFCPDAPLTRGEMAVFLSLGLGLHFAP